MTRIGILTGGGDCPGLNAVIRGIVRKGVKIHGHEFVGFRYGWAGVLDGSTIDLSIDATSGLLPRGGTILGTSRTNPYKDGADGTALVREGMAKAGVEALIPIGGEDTLGVAGRLAADGVPVVGVPKTIDNDLDGTDYTFGFDTAVQIATDAIDRLHTTAESHNRVLVVEVMGRHAGWIACALGDGRRRRRDPRARDAVRHRRGLRAPARAPLARPLLLDRRRERGRAAQGRRRWRPRTPRSTSSATCASAASPRGSSRRSSSARATRRAWSCSATCSAAARRPPSTACSRRATASRPIDALTRGESGVMVSLRGTDVRTVPLADALAEPKLLDPALYATAEVFFG